ncbi:MAG: type II toxin-antitoxin system VapC family toxin [Oscillospiraceae bacterium]|nr:type II toxin-antitoxin system VapC family toxin [Oscillospiraceae bacterium]
MKNLLDTHTVIWLAENSPKLSDAARDAILDSGNESYVSIASAWEVAIKIAAGKLRLDGGSSEFFNIIDANGFTTIPIEAEYVKRVEALPFHHRDPFDRILIASAMESGMRLISSDANMRKYDVPVVW